MLMLITRVYINNDQLQRYKCVCVCYVCIWCERQKPFLQMLKCFYVNEYNVSRVLFYIVTYVEFFDDDYSSNSIVVCV
jgi:hypothetical protein